MLDVGLAVGLPSIAFFMRICGLVSCSVTIFFGLESRTNKIFFIEGVPKFFTEGVPNFFLKDKQIKKI